MLGGDGRMRDWSHGWLARKLQQLGFGSLEQLESAILEYDDDQLSRIAEGGRQGQITHFDLMLLAAPGERFIERHAWQDEEWFTRRRMDILTKFRDNGI